jgi:hypothetical protein
LSEDNEDPFFRRYNDETTWTIMLVVQKPADQKYSLTAVPFAVSWGQ